MDSNHDKVIQSYQQIDEQNLREAVMSCRYFKRLEERGYLDELCARRITTASPLSARQPSRQAG
jgi:hypothetical protein